MIVEADAAFSGHKNKDLAKRIEQAMAGAALQAQAEGVTDPDEIRRLMLAARDRVKNVRS